MITTNMTTTTPLVTTTTTTLASTGAPAEALSLAGGLLVFAGLAGLLLARRRA